jgi:hypothetical protein
MNARNYFIILFILVSKLIFGQASVVGYYKSNFSIAGYFATQIDLRSDFTFVYEMVGHFSYDRTKGKYKTIGDTVYLAFEPDTSINLSASSRPKKYLFKHNKLFLLDINNKSINKQWGYKERLFRKRRFKQMNYYLQKNDNEVFEYWKT